jgi:hypothetical protein
MTQYISKENRALAMLRIRNIYPGSDFFGLWVDKIPDPDPHQRIEVFLPQETDTRFSNNIRDVHPG